MRITLSLRVPDGTDPASLSYWLGTGMTVGLTANGCPVLAEITGLRVSGDGHEVVVEAVARFAGESTEGE